MAEVKVPNDKLATLTLGQRIKALVEDARYFRTDFDKAMIEERNFALKQQHYEDETGETRDRRRIRPKGRELIGKLRHKVGTICKHLFYSVRPVDEETDPVAAKQVEMVLGTELNDPMKDYHQRREDMVLAALASRLGVVALDFVPGIGSFEGEVLPRTVDPAGRFYWTPGWKSPHDPTCPWVAEIKDMRTVDVLRMKRAGWKNTDQVVPDGGYPTPGSKGDATQAPGNTRLPSSASALPGPGVSVAEPRTTLIHFYERICPDTEIRPKKNSLRKLRPEDRFLRCDLCGYENRDHNGLDLPASETLPCPSCAATAQEIEFDGDPDMLPKLSRVEHEMDSEEVLSYPRGREVIIAPFSDCAVLVDLPWRKIRSVPYIVLQGYEHPYEPIGMSDTAYDWSLQLIADALMRQAYEQMADNRDLIIAPEDGLVDAAGEPWQFADSQGRVAYWTGQGNPMVQHFQGTGIPPGWREIFGQVQNVLMRDMGTSDISMGPEQSRDIAVGTIRAMQETGEIPTDHHIRRLHRAESIGFGVWVDLIRCCWSLKRLVRMYPKDGQAIFATIRGMDLPNVDVVVEAEPQIKDVDTQEVDALMKVLSAPKPAMKILAKKYGLSPVDINEYLAGMEEEKKNNQPKPEPPKPDALLSAMAAVIKAAPGYMTFDQFQQALSMAGVAPVAEPDEHGIMLMQKHLHEGAATLAGGAPGGLAESKPKGKFQGGSGSPQGGKK